MSGFGFAEEIERKRRADLEGGRFGFKKRDRPRVFNLVAEEYVTLMQPVLSDRGLTIEKCSLRHLLKAFGGMLPSDIDAGEISTNQRNRLRSGAAPKTINLELGTHRAILPRHHLWVS